MFLEFKSCRALRPSFKPLSPSAYCAATGLLTKECQTREKRGREPTLGCVLPATYMRAAGLARCGDRGKGVWCCVLASRRLCLPPQKKLNISERSGERWASSFTLCAAIFFTDAMPSGSGWCTSVCARASFSFPSVSLFPPSFPPPASSARMCFPVHCTTPGFYLFVRVFPFFYFARSSSSFVRSLPSQLYFLCI